MNTLNQTGFPAIVENFSTSADLLVGSNTTSDPASLFDVIRDAVVFETAELTSDYLIPESGSPQQLEPEKRSSSSGV